MVCKTCGVQLDRGMAFCPFCGTPVPEERKESVCPKCGAELTEGAQFCIFCGTAVTQGAQRPKQNKGYFGKTGKYSGRKIAIAVICAAVIIGGLFGIRALKGGRDTPFGFLRSLFFGNEDNYLYMTDSLILAEPYDNEISYLYNKNMDRIEVPIYANVYTSTDGSKAILFGEKLYYYADGELSYIDYTDYSGTISCDGSAVLYHIYYDRNDYNNYNSDLYLYRDGESMLICENERIGNAVLSPNGSFVVFSVVDDDWDVVNTFLWHNEAVEERDDLEGTIHISNDGKLAYAGDSDYESHNLYAVIKGERRLIGQYSMAIDNMSDYYNYCYFNYNDTELLYHYRDATYLSVNGEEGVQISPKYCVPLLPYNAQTRKFYADMADINVGVRHFAGTFFTSSMDNDQSRVLYLDKDLNMRTVVSGVSSCALANDGKTILYLRDGSIYRVDGTKENAEAKELVAGGVQFFEPTADGKAVYYVNNYDELYYVTAKGDSTYLHDIDTEGWYTWMGQRHLYDYDKLVFNYGNELYMADGTEVTTIHGPDISVDYVECGPFDISVSGDDYSGDWCSYFSYDGVNFFKRY